MGEKEAPEVTLVRLETKLDNALDTLKDHETRIRSVEKIALKAIGGASAIAFLVTIVFKYLLK